MPAPIRYAQAVTLKPAAAPVAAYYSGYGPAAVQDFRPGMVASVADPAHTLVTSNRRAVLIDFIGHDGTVRRASLYRETVTTATHTHESARAALSLIYPSALDWHADRYYSAELLRTLIADVWHEPRAIVHLDPSRTREDADTARATLAHPATFRDRLHAIGLAGIEDGAEYGSIPCLAGPPFSVWARACFPLLRHPNGARLLADADRYEDEIPSITVTLAQV